MTERSEFSEVLKNLNLKDRNGENFEKIHFYKKNYRNILVSWFGFIM